MYVLQVYLLSDLYHFAPAILMQKYFDWHLDLALSVKFILAELASEPLMDNEVWKLLLQCFLTKQQFQQLKNNRVALLAISFQEAVYEVFRQLRSGEPKFAAYMQDKEEVQAFIRGGKVSKKELVGFISAAIKCQGEKVQRPSDKWQSFLVKSKN